MRLDEYGLTFWSGGHWTKNSSQISFSNIHPGNFVGSANITVKLHGRTVIELRYGGLNLYPKDPNQKVVYKNYIGKNYYLKTRDVIKKLLKKHYQLEVKNE